MCSQGFRLNGDNETDKASKAINDTPQRPNKFKTDKTSKRLTEVMDSILDDSWEIQQFEHSIDLFPEVTRALKNKNAFNDTREALADALENSQGFLHTQQLTTDDVNATQLPRCSRDTMPGTSMAKISGGHTCVSPRVKISKVGTPEKALKDANTPGTVQVNSNNLSVGTCKGKANAGGTLEGKISDNGTSLTPKINHNATAEGKINEENVIDTPKAEVNGGSNPGMKITVDNSQDTPMNVNPTPRTPKRYGRGAKKLSKQEEEDCLDILDMFEDLSPFKQKPEASIKIPRVLKDDP